MVDPPPPLSSMVQMFEKLQSDEDALTAMLSDLPGGGGDSEDLEDAFDTVAWGTKGKRERVQIGAKGYLSTVRYDRQHVRAISRELPVYIVCSHLLCVVLTCVILHNHI